MNPLGSNNQNNFGNIAQIKQMMKVMQNPMSLVQSNPQFAQIMQMCQGKNPKDVFYSLCKQKGIDPNSILNQLRN